SRATLRRRRRRVRGEEPPAAAPPAVRASRALSRARNDLNCEPRPPNHQPERRTEQAIANRGTAKLPRDGDAKRQRGGQPDREIRALAEAHLLAARGQHVAG